MFSMLIVTTLTLFNVEVCSIPLRCAESEAPLYTQYVYEVEPTYSPKEKWRNKLEQSFRSFTAREILPDTTCEGVAPYRAITERMPSRSSPRHKDLIRQLSQNPAEWFIRKLLAVSSSGNTRLPQDFIEKVLGDHRLRLYEEEKSNPVASACRKFLLKETVLLPGSVERGIMFLILHESAFALAEKKHKVSRYKIAALLRMESNHCRFAGAWSVQNMLYSFFMIPDGRMRSADAFKRMRAHLALAYRYRWDPYEIRGSHRAAMGCGQFVPDTFAEQMWDTDADGDGIPSLSSPEDSIMIVAKYLVNRGWKPDDPAAQKDSLQKYLGGGSRDWQFYSETIIPYSEILRNIAKERGLFKHPPVLFLS